MSSKQYRGDFAPEPDEQQSSVTQQSNRCPEHSYAEDRTTDDSEVSFGRGSEPPRPPLDEAARVATPIIYWPENDHGAPALDSESAFNITAGLAELMEHHPDGGAIVSVHQPLKSLIWLEQHYDLPLLEDMRQDGTFRGPIPMQFPEVSALVIFGPHNESKAATYAQALANVSKFPVIARPAMDDPIIKSKASLATERSRAFDKSFSVEPGVIMHAHVDGGNNGGDSAEGPADGGSDPQGIGDGQRPAAGGENDSDGKADGQKLSTGSGGDLDGDDGRGGDDGGGDWSDWTSPVHRAQLSVGIEVAVSNSTGEVKQVTVPIVIISQTQFITKKGVHIQQDIAEEPQAQVHTELKVEFNPKEVLLQPSFATLGFLCHRPSSVFQSSALDVGFSAPRRTYKRGITKTIQTGVGFTAGLTGAGPRVTLSHSRGITHMVEAQDDKPMPPVIVRSEKGVILEKKEKSYHSCNYSYKPQWDPLNKKTLHPSPLSVRFAFGIDFFNTDAESNPIHPPRVSCINRHEIFISVSNPHSREIHGFILLFTTIVPDIRREKRIELVQRFRVDAKSGKVIDRTATHNSLGEAQFFGGILLCPAPTKDHSTWRKVLAKTSDLVSTVVKMKGRDRSH